MKTIFSKIVSKDETRKELAHVLVTDDRLVATNSYTLIEVKRDALSEEDKARLQIISARSDGTILMKPEELDMKKEILETMPIESGADFPRYEQIMPTEDQLNSHYSVVEVDPRKLADILQAVSKTFKSKQYQSIKLFVPKVKYDGTVETAQDKVVVKRADNSVTGVVMPLRNNK